MWEAIKTVPGAIGSWRENRAVLYQVVASIAAVLVITSVAGGPRPSDSLAATFHALGWPAVGSWFGADAPMFLAEAFPVLQSSALFGALALLARMVFVPLWRGRHEDNLSFAEEPFRLLGSPAAASVWVLLLVAAQQGDIAPVLLGWRDTAVTVAFWAAGLLAAVGAACLLLFRRGLRELSALVARSVLALASRAAFGLVVTAFAVGLAAMELPLLIIFWMARLRPDRSGRPHREAEIQRVEQMPLPAGATSIVNKRAA